MITSAYAKKHVSADSDNGSSSLRDSSSEDKKSSNNDDKSTEGGGDNSGSSGNGEGSNTGTGNTNTGSDENKDTSIQGCNPATDTSCSSEPTVIGPPNITCPGGSTPDSSGKCPEVTTGTDCTKTPNDPSCTPTPTPPPTTCPDGSQPDTDGKCPTTITDNNTTEGGNGGSGGGIPGLIGDNQTLPDNSNDTGRGLTGNETIHNITNVTSNATSSNMSKALSLSISFGKDPIVRGNKQTITVKVSDESSQRISSANVQGEVRYASGSTDNEGRFSGSTNNNGVVSHTWRISGNAIPGKFTATVHASKDGYKSESKSASFTVIPASQGGGGGGGHDHVARPSPVQLVKYFKESTDMPPNSTLYITNTSMHKDSLNDIIITGEIKNRGTRTANFVEVISTFYSINNQTIAMKSTFAKPSTLQSGQAAPFTVYLSPKDMPLNQINRVKYHISWKYAAVAAIPSFPSTTRTLNS